MRTSALALVVVLAFVVPVSVHAAAAPADKSTPLEQARAHFRRGVELYNEASFEAALAEFRKAHQLSPTFRVLYNIAQAYFELHDYVNAHRTLKQYLQEGGSEISAGRRAEVDEMSKKLEERIAHLEILVSKDGADVRVDDVSVGTSPLKGPVLVNAGPRKLAAVKPGHDIAVRLVTVAGTEKAKVVLEIPDLVVPASRTEPSGPPAVEAQGPPVAVAATAPPATASKPSRTGLFASLAVAGGCAVATGVFGYLALGAKKDFDSELNKISNTNQAIDDARTKTKNYAYVTDAFGAATLIATGVALYFAVAGGGDTPAKKSASPQRSVALAPALGGLVLHGRW